MGNIIRVNYLFHQDLKLKIEEIAKELDITESALVRVAVADFITTHKRKEIEDKIRQASIDFYDVEKKLNEEWDKI